MNRTPSLAVIHKIIDDVASRQGFVCMECALERTDRRYTDKRQTLNTNWDGQTNALFITVEGDDRVLAGKAAANFVAEASSMLSQAGEKVAVEERKGTILPRRFGRLLSVDLIDGGFPVCRIDEATENHLAAAFARINAYAKSIGFTDSCRAHPPLCNRYWGGKVFGAFPWSRSTSIVAGTPCDWGHWSLEVEITQVLDDPTVDPNKIVTELKNLLTIHTGKLVTERSPN